MKIDPNALETLEAVIDCGSVAAAAETLNKAQSAVSYHLRRLEEQMGVVVLDRSGYRLRLTTEGEAILAEARPLLRKLRDLGRFSELLEAGWEPRLRIFFDGAFPTLPIISAMRKLERENAPTQVDLRIGFLDGVQSAFARNDGDILIAANVDPRPDLAIASLPALEFILCCAASHPFANRSAIAVSELRDQTELIVPDLNDKPAFPAHHFRSRRVFHLCDFHTKFDAIRQGLGFGWLPQYMAAAAIASGELAEIHCVSGSRFQLNASIATRVNASGGRASDLIVNHLRSHGWDTSGDEQTR